MSSTIVRKGIIPAAGLGTRVRAIAGDLPKELLTVAAKPLIVHAIEGLAASGIRQIGVVISPAKESIRQFLLGEPGPVQPQARHSTGSIGSSSGMERSGIYISPSKYHFGELIEQNASHALALIIDGKLLLSKD